MSKVSWLVWLGAPLVVGVAGCGSSGDSDPGGMIASPLTGVESIMGVIEVMNPRGRAGFSDSDLELLQLFSNLAAASLQMGQSYDRVSRDNLGLRNR